MILLLLLYLHNCIAKTFKFFFVLYYIFNLKKIFFYSTESDENVEKEIKNVSKTYQRNRLNTSVPASSPKKTALTKRVILRFFPNMEIVISYMYRNFDENKLLQSRKSVQMNCETLGASLPHLNFDITKDTRSTYFLSNYYSFEYFDCL